jgi:hypothetical protein
MTFKKGPEAWPVQGRNEKKLIERSYAINKGQEQKCI